MLVALAEDGLDLLEHTCREADLDVPGPEVAAALQRLVVALIPLGPRLEFLLVRALVRRAQDEGVLAADLPVDWVVASANTLVYSAWELIASGRIAPVAAPGNGDAHPSHPDH